MSANIKQELTDEPKQNPVSPGEPQSPGQTGNIGSSEEPQSSDQTGNLGSFEDPPKGKLRVGALMCRAGRWAAAAAAVLLLCYYCKHPALYAVDKQEIFILKSGKTYLMMALTVIFLLLIFAPVSFRDRVNRILSWIWFAAAPFAVYFSLLYLNAEKFKIDFWALNKIALFLTFVFLFLLEGILLILTGSIRISVSGMAILIAVLGIANRFVISFRGMALSGADLFSLGTAMSVASSYTYEVDWTIFMEVVLTFGICLISMKLRGTRILTPVMRLVVLLIWSLTAGSYYYVCCRTDFLEEHEIRSTGFTHQLRYKQYDMLFTTLTTCFYLSVDKPEGYSLEKVKEIAEPYLEKNDQQESNGGEAEKQPNLIVIMNESFADYENIGNGLDLSEDCMPFLHSLTENTIKGYAYASIFGGNTPNSEYEFLTGNTMGFLPESSVGFHLFVRGELPSMVSNLKAEGYSALAMHPYRGTNYRRHIVYPQLGFDTYYTRDDFSKPQYIRSYISDKTLAKRIVSEYEKQKEDDAPFFSYNVTVQNHGDYYAKNTRNIDMFIEVENPEVDQTRTEIYVNLIRESDRVLEYLVETFQEEDEPTVILMFGDHQANLGNDTYEYLLGKPEEELTAEERMEKYKVPFVIWANYDISEETIEKTSLNYLYSILADRLGFPMTGYQKYLMDLQEEIPVLCAQGYWTKDGSFYELGDETSPYYEKVTEYQMLEYNDILGGKNRYLEFFGEVQE